ncbi:hypothetical protein Bbelb_107030 [Branchiostoma belcheri]|nr:hypothetical protein Bbelb_107030 [Branchiostoma belcheri]
MPGMSKCTDPLSRLQRSDNGRISPSIDDSIIGITFKPRNVTSRGSTPAAEAAISKGQYRTIRGKAPTSAKREMDIFSVSPGKPGNSRLMIASTRLHQERVHLAIVSFRPRGADLGERTKANEADTQVTDGRVPPHAVGSWTVDRLRARFQPDHA